MKKCIHQSQRIRFVQSVRLQTNQFANWIKTFDWTFKLKRSVNQACRLLSFSIMTSVDHFERLKGFSFIFWLEWNLQCSQRCFSVLKRKITFQLRSCLENIADRKLLAFQTVFRRKQQLLSTFNVIHAQNPLGRAKQTKIHESSRSLSWVCIPHPVFFFSPSFTTTNFQFNFENLLSRLSPSYLNFATKAKLFSDEKVISLLAPTSKQCSVIYCYLLVWSWMQKFRVHLKAFSLTSSIDVVLNK